MRLHCETTFSLPDKKLKLFVLERALTKLPYMDRLLLEFRYWDNRSIEEIALLFNLEWHEVDQAIEQSHNALLNLCRKDPAFVQTETGLTA